MSTNVTAQMVKELRERTQAGMSDCKNALVETGGDMEKAVEVILKKGLVKAAARAGRVASEGEVRVVVSADKKRGTVVEVNCQTDFVARGDEFKGFVTKVAEIASKLQKGADLLAQPFPGGGTVEDARAALVGKTGENTVVRRWECLEAKGESAYVQEYVHMGGKNASLVLAEAPSKDKLNDAELKSFVDNCAMQIVAMRPIVLKKDELSQQQVDKQREIFQAQLKEEGKPEQAWPKIIEGKVAKWYTEVALLQQDNVWDPPAGTVDKIRQELGKKLGGEVKLTGFVRYELGEGVEKKVDDFADEVAKMSGVSAS
jgi:elongation factor Ts